MIYLQHFIHGTKVALCEQEAAYDEKHGWVRYEPAVSQPEEEQQSDVIPIGNALSKTGKKK